MSFTPETSKKLLIVFLICLALVVPVYAWGWYTWSPGYGSTVYNGTDVYIQIRDGTIGVYGVHGLGMYDKTDLMWSSPYYSGTHNVHIPNPPRDSHGYVMYATTDHSDDTAVAVYYIQGDPEPPVANFTSNARVGVAPVQIQFYDNSTGPGINNRSWSFGDGYGSYLTNPSHWYNTSGNFTVSLTVNATGGQSTKQVAGYILVYPAESIHLDVDVRDLNTSALIPESQIGIYDSTNGEWRNTTCNNGLCGFMDTGINHQTPLAIGHSYTLAASKLPDYLENSTTVTFTTDHQLVKLYLAYPAGVQNLTNLKHLDIDTRSAQSNAYIEDANYQMYDKYNDLWSNKTMTTGAGGFLYSGNTTFNRPLEFNRFYTIYADRFGYEPTNITVFFTFDHQLETIYLTPVSGYNETNHLDIDIRNSTDFFPIEGADYGIYDYEHKEWRNATCASGAGGFLYTGTPPHNYPVKFGTTYQIWAHKAGYNTVYQDIVLSFDHQLFTLLLTPDGSGSTPPPVNATPTLTPLPTITPFTYNENLTFINFTYPNVTVPTSLPGMPEQANMTSVKAYISQRIPMSIYILDLIDLIMVTYNRVFMFVITIILFPVSIVMMLYNYVMSIFMSLFLQYLTMAYPILLAMQYFSVALPVKVINMITLLMAYKIITMIYVMVSKNKRGR